MQKIKAALISVFYKDGLEPIVKKLNELGVTIYSTGGTQKFIEQQGVPVVPVEELTDYPSILGGRVKTLHPKIFGGILARRENQQDLDQLVEYNIPEIDLTIVDLYPFEETVKAGGTEQEIIEKIDIGGISLIRAAGKNFKDSLVVSNRNQYENLLNLLNEKNGSTEISDRKNFAAEAFMVSSHYDTAIFNYFNEGKESGPLKVSIHEKEVLRYGENPHQKAVFFGKLEEKFDKLHGKALSYNNLVDIDAAVNVISEFSETTFAILKHTNTCGLASRPVLKDAYLAALACDNQSAFGGILITNKTIDLDTAKEITKLFCEVVIAPDFDADALEVLKEKKNRVMLKQKTFDIQKKQYKSLLNGVLMQDYDDSIESKENFRQVTKKSASAKEIEDLEFAVKAMKHIKSNCITLVKDKQLIGMGSGQTSRVDALKQAIAKANFFGFDVKDAVMASEAFFPFPDCVEIACEVGIKTVVQPGGSIKDQLSIDFCDNNNMSMQMTGVRHFKH
ncbi:MAG: bifunctional phosphoribosylaminoimidazolecarboxamide formyltransferase/IMP cyclohydrolase [Chitinophagales bacterium]